LNWFSWLPDKIFFNNQVIQYRHFYFKVKLKMLRVRIFYRIKLVTNQIIIKLSFLNVETYYVYFERD